MNFSKRESYLCAVVGACLSPHWQVCSDKGVDPWVVEVLSWGYCSLPVEASTVCGTHPFSVVHVFWAFSQLFGGDESLRVMGPVSLVSLNLRVCKSLFKVETLQSVLLSVQSGDWLVSIDSKDTYLQVLYIRMVVSISILSL